MAISSQTASIKERPLDTTPLDTTRYRPIPFAEFAAAMASVEQVVCTQAWLGYADVLFVDLGDFDPPLDVQEREAANEPLFKGRRLTRKHFSTRFCLHSELCDWEITQAGQEIGTSYDDHHARVAAQLLTGKRLLGWLPGAGGAATFRFDDDIYLCFIPYDEVENAWSLRGENQQLYGTRGNGETYQTRTDVPLKN